MRDTIDVKELIDAVGDNNVLDEAYSSIRKIFDGEPVNKNPLKEIPNAKMKIYAFLGLLDNNVFFDTEEELKEWIKNNDTTFGSICIIEYIGNMAGSNDVVRVIENDNEYYYTPVDAEGFGIYNNKRSIYRGEYVWEYNHGSIKNIYDAFKKRGITLEDDIYGEIEEKQKSLIKYCKNNNLFNMK